MAKDNIKHEIAKELSEAPSSDGAKEKLIEAATKLFAVQGFDGTSTRDIAKLSGLNISLISYYFGGKEGLYKAVIQDFANYAIENSNQLLLTLDVEKLTKESFCAFMKELLARMIPLKYASKEVQHLMHRELLQGLPHSRDVFEALFSSILEKIVGLYKRGQKKGFIRSDVNPYIVFISMIHSVDQYILIMGCDCDLPIKKHLYKLPDDVSEYCDQLYKIYVEGVLK